MLELDFEEIPDLRFTIELMVCEPPHVASRLRFDCRPKGLFLGLPINGKRAVFTETSSIGTGTKELRSLAVIDNAAIEDELGRRQSYRLGARSSRRRLSNWKEGNYSNIQKSMLIREACKKGAGHEPNLASKLLKLLYN
jgi:hypothetical protein